MALNFPDPAAQTPVNTWSPTSTPSASTNGLTYLWDGAKWTTEGGVPNLHWTRAGSVLSPTNAGDDVTTTGDVNAANVVAAGDVQTTSLNGGPLAGFRNQIINGDFRVWQRGTTVSKPGHNFSADRWQGPTDNGISRSTGVPAGFSYSLETPAMNTNYLETSVELPDDSPGQFAVGTTWTLSYWTNAPAGFDVELYFCDKPFTPTINNPLVTGTPTHSVTSTGETSNGFTRYAVTVTVTGTTTAGTKCLGIGFDFPSSTSFRFTGVQLEPGPVATPFEYRPIGTELALCQRYYNANSGMAVPLTRAALSGGNETTGYGRVQFPTQMRSAPVVSYVVNAGTLGSASIDSQGFRGRATSLAGTILSSITSYTADAEL